MAFYSEMIDDRMEEGLSEEQVVCDIGNVNEIISRIIADIPLAKLVREKAKPKRWLRMWEIVLLVLGSPIWLSLLIAVFAVILSVYAALWSVIISLWAMEVSLWGCVLAGITAGIGLVFHGNAPAGVALIGAAIACAGLSIFLFYGCKGTTKGIILLTKKIALGMKSRFIKKEEAE